MSKTVLVAGGAGYIGSHMALMLRDAGYRVIVFDNLSRGFRDAAGDAEFFFGDLRDPPNLERCFAQYDIDLVMHFAALAYVGESVQAPAAYYDTNVRGALNLLDAMLVRGVNKLVFSSTCAIYGEPDEIPITEGHGKNPINPYGRTKLMMELAMQDYAYAHGLNSISLRYFNAAGCDTAGRVGERHDPETHLIPLVLREAMRILTGGEPADTQLAVFGEDFDTPDGSCIRDYIHVADLCRAHLLAAERLCDADNASAEAFNLSNGKGYSVKEVITACERVTGMGIPYKAHPRRAGDPAVLVGSSRLAREVLGWNPHYTELTDIVATAWAWMRGKGLEDA
jgi:UDP-glucose-4-epimerase GalE